MIEPTQGRLRRPDLDGCDRGGPARPRGGHATGRMSRRLAAVLEPYLRSVPDALATALAMSKDPRCGRAVSFATGSILAYVFDEEDLFPEATFGIIGMLDDAYLVHAFARYAQADVPLPLRQLKQHLLDPRAPRRRRSWQPSSRKVSRRLFCARARARSRWRRRSSPRGQAPVPTAPWSSRRSESLPPSTPSGVETVDDDAKHPCALFCVDPGIIVQPPARRRMSPTSMSVGPRQLPEPCPTRPPLTARSRRVNASEVRSPCRSPRPARGRARVWSSRSRGTARAMPEARWSDRRRRSASGSCGRARRPRRDRRLRAARVASESAGRACRSRRRPGGRSPRASVSASESRKAVRAASMSVS